MNNLLNKWDGPTNELKTCVISIQTHTLGHPKLVHARLAQLREKNWKEKYTIESLLQTPQEVKDEREAARQLVSKLPRRSTEISL